MKKILSLLVLLVTTVTAMATDYVADCVVSCNNQESTMSGATMSVVDNGDGTYNITLKALKSTALGMDFGDLTLSNLSGTTEGGVTTISVAEVNAKFTSGDYMEAPESPIKSFVCKFNAEKLYANYGSGSMLRLNNWQRTAFTASFGTDEGFESTGGGSTGGEDKPAIVTVKENFQSTEGSSWGENVTIDWNTQKLVASINLASTGSDKGFLGVTKKGQTAGWNNYGIIFYNTNGSTVQGYAPGQPNNANTDQVTKGEDPVRFEISKDGGVKCQGNVVISASNIAHLTNQSEIVVGAADKPAGALYNYIKVVPLDWKETTEPTEPEVTVTFEKQYADKLYSLADGTPSAMGDATVTLKEMSDNTISMSLAFTGMNVESTDLVKGTDEKDRITYTGTTNFQGTNFAVKALRYTKDEEEKLYMTLIPTDGTTLAFGEDPDYVAPAEPEDVTLWENYQADGNGFSKTATINWDKQKIVASIDFSNGGDDKDILAMTTGESFAAFQTSTYRTMHWYCQQSVKQMSGFFAKDGAGNNNTGRMDVADCLAKFEISKAEGLKVNGEVKMSPAVLDELFASNTVLIGSGESPKFSKAFYNYIKVVSLDWTETTKPEVTVKEEKSFTDDISMVVGDMSEVAGQAQVTIKEMTDETISMTLAVVGQEGAEYTASGFTKTVDTEKNRTTYTGTLNIEDEDYDVTALVYTEGTVEKLYMVAKGAEYNYVIGTNPDAPTVVSDKKYTSNLRIYDGEEPVVEETEAQVNVTKYSDETYKITLKDVSLLNQTSDLVFVGKALVDETAAADEPLTIMAKSDGATTNFFGEQMNASFELTEVSADEVKMEFAIESENFSYMGQFNYEEEKPEPEVYTSNLHIYDAAAPKTDLFKADKANVEFLATETGEFTLTLKDVTLNEKTQDLVFTGTLPTTEPGGQEPLAEEGEGEVTPDEPAMVLNATADEATATFLGAASATAEFSISYNAADEFMMTFTMKAGEKNYGGEFNYEVKTPAAEPFCKENYVADGNGFEWEIPVDWDTQKIVMSIDPSTCTGSCEHVIGLGAVPTAWNNTLNLYRTSADQMLQGYFQVPGGSNNNTDKFAETVPFLVEVSKAQGFVVNGEVKIAASAMSYLFTLPTVKMGTGEGVNDKSRATYNYVKVVDKDWTKDPEAGINATTVAEGEFEVFSVDGVKLSKLQKGLNIVRSADGKVKKVLVK